MQLADLLPMQESERDSRPSRTPSQASYEQLVASSIDRNNCFAFDDTSGKSVVPIHACYFDVIGQSEDGARNCGQCQSANDLHTPSNYSQVVHNTGLQVLSQSPEYDGRSGLQYMPAKTTKYLLSAQGNQTFK